MEVTIDGQQFIKTSSCGDGNCFLYTLLEFMQQQRIDPFLDMVSIEQQTSVQVYREFLVTNLDKFNKIGLQRLKEDKWKTLKLELENDVKTRNLLEERIWFPASFLKLIVTIYKEIDEVYLVEENNQRQNVSWSRFAVVDKVAKRMLVRSDFNVTKETLIILFTKTFYKRRKEYTAHYDLLTATTNVVKVTTETPEQKMKRKHEVQFRNEALTIELNACYYEKLSLQNILDNSDNNSYDIKKEEIQNQINKVEVRIKQIQRELRMKQQKLDDEKTVDLTSEDESQGSNSQTNSQPTERDGDVIVIEDAISDDEEKSGNLIQNRSVMSLSRMRL